MTPDEETAARLAGAVWAAVNAAGGPETAALTHLPAVLDPAWLAALPLPAPDALPPGHNVSMPGPADDGFEQHADPAAARAAYQRRPRTRIITDIGWNNRVEWAAHAARHLTRLAQTGPRIVIAVYCCPSLKVPMLAALRMPMWVRGKSPAAVRLRGFGRRGAVGCGRGAGQESVTSVMAAWAACSSTMAFPAA
jgi:hypothetical protein